jgi:GT2 family glycosyltransferase
MMNFSKSELLDVTIGITTWNGKALLQACLQSIYRNPSSASCEIVVIDNASTDGTSEMVRTNFPRTTLIEKNTNDGWTAGCNQIARNARSRYVILLNEDTTIENDVFTEMAVAMDQLPYAGIGAPCLIWPDGERQPSCRRFPDPISLLLRGTRIGGFFPKRLRHYLREDIDLKNPSVIDWAIGACLIVRKEVFEKIGYMDERFAYHDDTDFCYRALKSGFATVFLPHCVVVHHYGRRSAQKWFTRSRWNHIKAIILLFRKHGLALNKRKNVLSY